MKKIIWVLVFSFIFLGSTAVAFSKEDRAEIIQYQLPHPGLLPDNRFYFLKTLRDRIVWFITSDSLKKAQFDLLSADKRLNAALHLVKKGNNNYQLVQSTISKGENYFEEAIEKTIEAKKQGVNISDMVRQLSSSSQKHQQVLKEIAEKAPQNMKESFNSLQKRMTDLEKRVNKLLPT